MKRIVIAFCIIAALSAFGAAQQRPRAADNAALRYWMAFAQMNDSPISTEGAARMDAIVNGKTPWDEQKFLASLRAAENTPRKQLKPDGNRAVIYCSTTDPYQVIRHPDPARQRELAEHARILVRRVPGPAIHSGWRVAFQLAQPVDLDSEARQWLRFVSQVRP